MGDACSHHAISRTKLALVVSMKPWWANLCAFSRAVLDLDAWV